MIFFFFFFASHFWECVDVVVVAVVVVVVVAILLRNIHLNLCLTSTLGYFELVILVFELIEAGRLSYSERESIPSGWYSHREEVFTQV